MPIADIPARSWAKSPVQFVDCNWKVAHTYSSGVIDGVGGGSRNADKSDFTHAACTAQEAEGYFYADRIT